MLTEEALTQASEALDRAAQVAAVTPDLVQFLEAIAHLGRAPGWRNDVEVERFLQATTRRVRAAGAVFACCIVDLERVAARALPPDEWMAVCERRSQLEFLRELYPDALDAGVLACLSRLDGVLRSGAARVPVALECIPPNTPAAHGWWWYPSEPSSGWIVLTSDASFEALRVLAVGTDLQIPELEYRMLPASALDSVLYRSGLDALVAEHGGVLLQAGAYQAGAYDDEDWSPVVLLRVEAPWLTLTTLAGCFGVSASASAEPARPCHFVGLFAKDPLFADWDDAPRCAATPFVRAREGAWESRAWCLSPHPLFGRHPLRDWGWVWNRATIGPLSLSVTLKVPVEDIEAFIAACAPIPYVEIDPRLAAQTHFAWAQRSYEASVRRFTGPPLEHLHIFERGLILRRSYSEPSDAIVAFDSALLAALARGALGELTWDIIDLDWGEYLATGDDAASLGDYLSLESDTERQLAAWRARFQLRSCDASAARTAAEVVEILSVFLGAPHPVSDEAFDAWLAAQPLDGLPRCLQIVIAPALREKLEGLFQRIHRGQPRIRLMGAEKR